MKKHDWVNKTEGPATPDMSDKAVKKRRREVFERFAEDPGKQWREDSSGGVAWENVSAANKCHYMASHAACLEVSFARLAKAVTDVLGGLQLTADEQKHLRTQFDAARKLLAPNEPDAELGFDAMVEGNGSRGSALGKKREKDRGMETWRTRNINGSID